MKKLIFIFLATLILVIQMPLTYSKTDWNVVNDIYNPDGAPVIITKVESHWQNYRAPELNAYGQRTLFSKKPLEEGIWCKTYFKLPEEKDGGKKILAIKFGVWYFNPFDELLGAYVVYNMTENSKDEGYIPGKDYKFESVTSDTNIDSTHRKTIIFPFEVKFTDDSRWFIDTEKLFNWFKENNPEFKNPEFEKFFPEERFGSKENWIIARC
jgi:hypothetical protein